MIIHGFIDTPLSNWVGGYNNNIAVEHNKLSLYEIEHEVN